MAISFIGSAEAIATNGGDATLTLPAMSQDDFVVVAYSIGDNDNIDENMAMVTAGYTEIADLFANDTQDCNLGVFRKFMGATPDTTAVVDGLGGADAAVTAVCLVFRGVDTVTPLDVVSATATGINTMHPDPPSIDWATAGTWTVIAGASGHDIGGTDKAYTFPTGYTTNARDVTANDTSDCTVGMGYNTAPADPENPGVMTLEGTDSVNYAWCAVAMALRAATGAQTVSPALIDQSGTVFAPTLAPSGPTQTPALIDQSATIFAPTITSNLNVPIALIDQSGTVFAPTVIGPQDLAVGLIDQSAAIFAPAIVPTITISVPLIDQSGVVFAPSLDTGSEAESVEAMTVHMGRRYRDGFSHRY